MDSKFRSFLCFSLPWHGTQFVARKGLTTVSNPAVDAALRIAGGLGACCARPNAAAQTTSPATRKARIGIRNYKVSLSRHLLRRGIVERTLHRVVGIGGNRMVAPQPTHHVRQDRAPLLLTVPPDPPGVIEVVALVRQRPHQAHVLQEPVPELVVLPVAPDAPVVVASILQVDA